MHSIFRIIKYAFQDMARNFSLSFMTVFILILMLLSANALWAVDITTREAVQLVKQQINLSLYFVPAATDKNVVEVKKYLYSFPEVLDIQVLSRDEVLAMFKNRHSLSAEVLSALDELGANPFGPTMIIKTREPKDYKKVMTALDVPEYDYLIESKSFDEHEDAIERIQNITNRVEEVMLWLCVVFVLISFMVIFNTIRVAIYTQRIEIGIKRLVGASNWFIRGPYLVESLIFTTLSVLANFAVILLVLRWIDPYLSLVFPNSFTLTSYYSSHILLLAGIQFAAVLFLTTFSSGLAMRRQLKV